MTRKDDYIRGENQKHSAPTSPVNLGYIILFSTESNCRSVLFNPFAQLLYLDHLRHVALRPSVFCGIFDFDKDNEEEVVPHVVLLLDVLLESHRLVVKLVPLKA